MSAANKKKAEDFKESGNKAYSAKNYKEAITLYTKAVDADPTNHIYYSNRSASYYGLQNWDLAMKDALKCIELKGDWSKGYFRKAVVLMELKKYEEAVDAFQKSVNYDPGNADIRARLDEAIELVKKNKPRVNPDGTPMNPAQIAKEEGNDLFKSSKYEEAAKAYTRGIELAKDPELKAVLYCNRATCYSQHHMHSEVVKDATECLNIQPNNLKALIRRGLAYEALEKMELANTDLRKVLSIDSSVAVAQQAVNRINNAMRQMKK